ncbi:MAG: single-stranded-DNA-specific exonuclease RecJ [Coriobacteriia bacterium]|nr:single-stranded-DNA-specific exonuclease RecJ [Coriobacteriia bacterium]
MNEKLGHKRWHLHDVDEALRKQLEEVTGLPRLAATVMAARNIKPEDAQAFLHPSLSRDWLDPFDIPNMQAGVDRLKQAILQGEKIAVIGDFDVDGISATAVMTGGLLDLGAQVDAYIPRRFDEGYGLSKEVINRVIEGSHPKLIVTVDTGIAAKEEVSELLARNIDVVVTDHHEPSEFVPEHIPVIDPKLDELCKSHEIAGVVVALKVICVLGKELNQPDLWRKYTEIAALGTISDMMVLTRENRAIVYDGIMRMRNTERYGLVALAKKSKIDLSNITADALSFSIIPRLNASGRISDPKIGLDLLISQDMKEAEALAQQLEEINDERRAYESDLTEEAFNLAESTYKNERCIVLGGEGWHEGVKGIVSSRLVNRFHVPVLIFTISDGVAHGSGRSVGTIDLFKAVEQCSDLLIQFGGHAGAVGVTIEAANLDAFRERLQEVLAELDEEEFVDTIQIDAEVDLSLLNYEQINALEALRPFGQGNRVPIFLAKNVILEHKSRVGKEGEHLRFLTTNGKQALPSIMFRTPNIEKIMDYQGVVDIVFEAQNETWQGRTKPKLMVRDIFMHRSEEKSDANNKTLIDELFNKTDQILSNNELSGIVEAESFYTKIAGVSFDNRELLLKTIKAGDELQLRREPDNAFDANAIALDTNDGKHLGYINRQIAQIIAPVIDSGTSYRALVKAITGGGAKRLGVNVEVQKLISNTSKHKKDEARRYIDDKKRALAGMNPKDLREELRALFIGDNDFLEVQAQALEHLSLGESLLCVMATGRGKSLIFHIHAALKALLDKKASVFVYPLRALVNDQAFHLTKVFKQIGLTVKVLTGETSLRERNEAYQELADGLLDVILTTPEFLSIHVQNFAKAKRIGFVVIDEAHHAGMAKGGHRDAYNKLPHILKMLDKPQVLAVTATANDEVSEYIGELASIDRILVDDAKRENLRLDDGRNTRHKETRLISLVAEGAKTLIYVNSREQSIHLAALLRKRIPSLAHKIAFYNAGLSKADRAAVEEALRSSQISTIVATSAFGEGVNLPDVRHVILYHLPFGMVEFNQMSGRAGRDKQEAWVHILFGSQDARINERIIEAAAPSRETLVALYKTLRSLSAHEREKGFSKTNSEIAQLVLEDYPKSHIDERSISTGIAIFKELGFLSTKGFGFGRVIYMDQHPSHMDLENSIRYLEGLRSKDAFQEFKSWILSAEKAEILDRFIQAISPTKYGA